MKLLLVLLSACTLYEPGGGPTPLCPGGQTTGIDPDTGVCETYGDECQASAGIHVAWAACRGPCDQLSENACLATAACHAAYAGGEFASCWNTVLTVSRDGSCTDVVDAWNCATHDNCASVLVGGRYANCIAEPR